MYIYINNLCFWNSNRNCKNHFFSYLMQLIEIQSPLRHNIKLMWNWVLNLEKEIKCNWMTSHHRTFQTQYDNLEKSGVKEIVNETQYFWINTTPVICNYCKTYVNSLINSFKCFIPKLSLYIRKIIRFKFGFYKY